MRSRQVSGNNLHFPLLAILVAVLVSKTKLSQDSCIDCEPPLGFAAWFVKPTSPNAAHVRLRANTHHRRHWRRNVIRERACCHVDPEAGSLVRRAVKSGTGSDVVAQWRDDRRSRLLRSLDWSRYHLQVCFVDACEPSHSRARLASLFFKRVCKARGDSALLYCEAGGMPADAGARDRLAALLSVPGLGADDQESFARPLEEFLPSHVSLYDAVVATDDETCAALRRRLSEQGFEADADHLCVLGDYVDAYDVMCAEESEGGEPAGPAAIAPGILTAEGIRAALANPGPLRGAPRRKPVGPPLGGLPREWSEQLWPMAGSPNELLSDAEDSPERDGRQYELQMMGRLLRSTVGLQRALASSVPEGMKWWNDEE